MLKSVRGVAAGALALAGVAVAGSSVQAMPVPSLAPTVAAGTGIEKAYVVCGPFRCWHRYGWGWHRPFYGYGWGWHRPFYRYGWGWHRPWGWHRWHRW